MVSSINDGIFCLVLLNCAYQIALRCAGLGTSWDIKRTQKDVGGHKSIRDCPEEGCEGGGGSARQGMWVGAEVLWFLQPRAEKAEGRPHGSLQLLTRKSSEKWHCRGTAWLSKVSAALQGVREQAKTGREMTEVKSVTATYEIFDGRED